MTNILFVLTTLLLLTSSASASVHNACKYIKNPGTDSLIKEMITRNALILNDLGGVEVDSLRPSCTKAFEEHVFMVNNIEEAESFSEIMKPTGRFVFPLCSENFCPIVAVIFWFEGRPQIASVGRSGQAKIIEQAEERKKKIGEKSGELSATKWVSMPDYSLDFMWMKDSTSGEESVVIASGIIEAEIRGPGKAMSRMDFNDVLAMLADFKTDTAQIKEKMIDFKDKEVTPDSDLKDDLPAGLSATVDNTPSKNKQEKPMVKKVNDAETTQIDFQPSVDLVVKKKKVTPPQLTNAEEEGSHFWYWSPLVIVLVLLGLAAVSNKSA